MAGATRIVILGGGFGGVYTALALERALKFRPEIEILLVSRENFLLFTPMLHEVAASDLDVTDVVTPIHTLLKRAQFFCGEVEQVDTATKTVILTHGASRHSHEVPYTQLIVALGAVTNFFDLPGLADHALTMKSLGDALCLRNRMIAALEEADFECCAPLRERLLTFVVAGGGFAGVETVAAMQDFLSSVLPLYRNIRPENIRVVLVHSGKSILPELDVSLGRYAADLLMKRGVRLELGKRVASFDGAVVHLNDGSSITCGSLVWTAGTSPHPMLATISCSKQNDRIFVEETLQVSGVDGLWALGDCAAVPDRLTGGFHPPTAQHASRQAFIVAHNIAAQLLGGALKPFRFRTLGQLASLGHRKGVAQVLGFRFSGFFAWWLWRTVYLFKLPGFERKLRVALNWSLDVLLSKDTVQIPTIRSQEQRTNASTDLKRPASVPGEHSHAHQSEPASVVTRVYVPVLSN